MAIKMDGHTITALKLKASNGTEVIKQLTEEGTIPTPTGTKQITANGTYDISQYASIVVNVTSAKTLESISAVYSGGNVEVDSAIDNLKASLVVTAHYTDSSTQTIANEDYTLSGTIAEGENTITVSYDGKTTTFTVVGEASDLPEGYTSLEYIRSTGTQYIVTNNKLNGNSEVELEYGDFVSSSHLSIGNAFFGVYAYETDGTSYLLRAGNRGEGEFTYANGVGEAYNGVQYVGKHTIKVTTTDILIDGSSVYTKTPATFTGTVNMPIFAQYATGSGNFGRQGVYKLYSMTISENYEAVAHFIPALDGDGVPCLYDTIAQHTYYNAGSGTFEYA